MHVQDQEKEAMVLSEKLAEDGDVDGSMAKMAEAEGLQAKWKELFDSYTQPDRTMSVCEICGVFVQSTDNEQRRLVRALCSPPIPWFETAGVVLSGYPRLNADMCGIKKPWSPYQIENQGLENLSLPQNHIESRADESCVARKHQTLGRGARLTAVRRLQVSDSSVQEHVQGKQYLGWSAIRDKLQELQGTWGQKEPERHRSKDMDRERDRHR